MTIVREYSEHKIRNSYEKKCNVMNIFNLKLYNVYIPSLRDTSYLFKISCLRFLRKTNHAKHSFK